MGRFVKLRTSAGQQIRVALENWGSGLDHAHRRWVMGDDYWQCVDTGETAESSGRRRAAEQLHRLLLSRQRL
jgi:hypothetical protein